MVSQARVSVRVGEGWWMFFPPWHSYLPRAVAAGSVVADVRATAELLAGV